MTDNVIKVEGLSKRYMISHQAGGTGGFFKYKRFSDVVINAAQVPFRALQKKRAPNPAREEFWALKDVSFAVKQGESVGIIGRNGAGKSTLLKILSRITEPSGGRIEIEGRVASLLEVGTGFHPELTGRENIYLNGAILGMKRSEIRKKFDEIVAFAEVEKFLDTPVKHFSSGMYMRLAFAVAAHLESEILIVDEVLAVGDLQFQKKCLGKMEHITDKEGRTVLFVSHNMDSITKLCSKALLLTTGSSGALDVVEKVTHEYLSQTNVASGMFVTERPGRSLRSVRVDEEALRREQLIIRIGFRFPGTVDTPIFGVVIYTEGGSPIFGSNSLYHPPAAKIEDVQEGEVAVTFGQLPLWSGRYMISVWLGDGRSPIDHEEYALTFEFVSPSTPLNAPPVKNIGPIHLWGEWVNV